MPFPHPHQGLLIKTRPRLHPLSFRPRACPGVVGLEGAAKRRPLLAGSGRKAYEWFLCLAQVTLGPLVLLSWESVWWQHVQRWTQTWKESCARSVGALLSWGTRCGGGRRLSQEADGSLRALRLALLLLVRKEDPSVWENLGCSWEGRVSLLRSGSSLGLVWVVINKKERELNNLSLSCFIDCKVLS